ncbi:MAG TPA: 1-(5-phosphoribosyl)-5-[(5-phosphoribosylamino)methylideneamino]imidazole-4-carboxamide isomerase [Rudaea sp.]|nr:1-(5-phosphoribosyl)-5-[(5-phosphoribosylamino)methylideneamino]imidazole-4-carboxamide isomerase [Rudaea sp.]
MLTIPAIDLRGARIVRLRQGDFARETAYAADPVALAGAFADAGARWLHVVDLDGARDGAFGNLRTIEAIARSRRLHVQAGGGVRTRADVQRLLDAGVNRVVVGSIAVRDADTVAGWIADFGAERVCVALDARHVDGVWKLHSAGWARDEGASLFDLAARYARCGARHVLCTDIGRDGMLAGPNLELYAQLRTAAPSLGVIASGGVRDVADLRALRAGGVAAAVLGRSLLEGHLRIEEALAC